MDIIKIPFGGITRNTDDGLCQDGECMELINARVNNASLEPISTPVKVATFSEKYNKIFFHPIANKYICVTEEGKLIAYDEQFQHPDQLSPDVTGVHKVEFVGRTLCALTNTGIKYFLLRNDSYTYIGDKPEYVFSVMASDEKDIEITDKIYDCQFTDAVAGTLKIDYRDVDPFIDFLDACKNEALAPYKDKARYAEPICVRAAFKLYDGSYIAHSPVCIIFPSKSIAESIGKMRATYISKGSNTEHGAIKIKNWTLHTFLIKYNFSFINIASWRDLIISFDIFISRPFSLIDVEACKNDGITIGNISEQISLARYGKDGMLEKIMSLSSQMYLSVSEQGGDSNGYIQEAQVSNTLLPDDNYTHNSLCASVSYVYNSRLHLGNIKNILFGGFLGETPLMVDAFNGNSVNTGAASLKTFTYVTTDYGEKIIYNTGGVFHPLPPIFCYPDYRATKVVIYAALLNNNGQLIYKKRTLDLKKASGLNMSFYLGWNEGPISYGVSPIDLSRGTTITASEYDNPPIETDNIEYAPNKIKVSELNNPLSFPAKQTYTPSNDEIIALHSNTSALSQGQFGQYPLYVFCKDGIYSMQVGTGDIVYASSAPVSRDVCISSSVCGLDSAIAFPTEKGLMIVSGANTRCVSDKLDGFLPSCVLSSPVITKIMGISGYHNLMSEVVFRDYLKEARIGYNYQESEIIVTNPDHPYSYVYNMRSETWHKISVRIINFVNTYPNTYVITQNNNSCQLYNLNNNHRSVSTMALLTRPIKLGTNSHKRILQTALRGIVKRALSDLYLRGEPVMFRGEGLDIFSDVGFYILGSNDAEHFSLISGRESIEDIRDLVTKMNKSKAFKYFMVALVGGVRSDVSINYVEMIADEAFENRLR